VTDPGQEGKGQGMWIIDSYYRHGNVHLWEKGGVGGAVLHKVPVEPSFYFRLPDADACWQMLDALGNRYRLRECTFNTVYGPAGGFCIHAGRKVADAIGLQTDYEADLYNVDVRPDHRYLAEQRLFPCGEPGESRFSPGFPLPSRVLEIEVRGNPCTVQEYTSVCVRADREIQLAGTEKTVITDLADIIGTWDPDVVLFPGADTLVSGIVRKAGQYGLEALFSRSGTYRQLDAKSYWSYGKTEYRGGSLMPDGRLLIDTRSSFNYREGGLSGVILAARLTGLSPNLAARFTAGTLISGYEVYEALARGIAVPYRKNDAEGARNVSALKACDRGGMMFQPVPGLYEDVFQIDFTSLYPAVIVHYNLSPETLHNPGKQGFLPEVLAPLLELRYQTKQLKKESPRYRGADSILKWMLVTCFGYTGYKNAKFGRIEVHEQITSRSRDVLVRSKDIAEKAGANVLHGIVDCLWLQGPGRERIKEQIENETGLFTELESYSWIAFLPMPDGFGAYNRYYGRLTDGSVKIRGISARRGDTPAWIRSVQSGMLDLMGKASSRSGLNAISGEVEGLYRAAVEELPTADPREMAIHRQVSRLDYLRRCPEASAVDACRAAGISVSPGMEIGYVVTDARTWKVELAWEATGFDSTYYRTLLDRAWKEIEFSLCASAPGKTNN
jgi:DNA polymerase, archaea type